MTKISNVPNPSKIHSKRPETTNEICETNITMNYEKVVSCCVTMLILNQTSYFPLLSNVCHLGLSNVPVSESHNLEHPDEKSAFRNIG